MSVLVMQRHGKKKGEILLMTAMVVEFVEDFMLENKKNAFQVYSCFTFVM